MRQTLAPEVENGRTGGPKDGGPYGAFLIVCPVHARQLLVIATDGRFVQAEADDANRTPWTRDDPLHEGHPIFWWEHLSVSGKYFAPNWAEMCWIKDQFWLPEEVVVQYHVPPEDHVNIAKTCLHLWRLKPRCMPIVDLTDPTLCVSEVPCPPSIAVGPKNYKPL
jgi:hypothetical protein